MQLCIDRPVISTIFLVLLGILQGVTEVLPVSSSGHLVIAQSLIPGFHQPGVLLDVSLHLGSLVAVLVYFRRDLINMASALVLPHNSAYAPARRLLWLVLIGSLPAALIGFLFRQNVERLFSEVWVSGAMLLVTGVLLFISDRLEGKGRALDRMHARDALTVGLAQGLAILPGLSRSGATIFAGIFAGVERGLALRYSFLLSIPVIIGAFVLEVVTHAAQWKQNIDVAGYSAGTVAAFLVGYLSILVLLRVLHSRRLSFFAYYCWVVGGGVLFMETLSLWP